MCAPVFHYLSVCDAENGHSCKRNPLTGGWCMHERTCVCTSEGKTLYHLISLRNQFFGGDMTIGESGQERWMDSLASLKTGRKCWHAVGALDFYGNKPVCESQIISAIG